MGCALAVSLGVAEARRDREVVAVVGDGDLVMGAGSLWSLSGLRPKNLVVLLLDDGRYSITGGQKLIAPEALVAVLDGLPAVSSARATSREEVAEAIRKTSRPAVVLAKIDEPTWPGPSPFVDPTRVRSRFSGYAASAPA
jgi:thiamine pyrophosphate-dependent acetolactate synthase large subunit-like protein